MGFVFTGHLERSQKTGQGVWDSVVMFPLHFMESSLLSTCFKVQDEDRDSTGSLDGLGWRSSSPTPLPRAPRSVAMMREKGKGSSFQPQPTKKKCKHTPGKKVRWALGVRTIQMAGDRAECLPRRVSFSQDGLSNAELVWELSEAQLMAASPCRGDSSGRCTEQTAEKGEKSDRRQRQLSLYRQSWAVLAGLKKGRQVVKKQLLSSILAEHR